MPLRVLVVAEGPSEYGRLDYPCASAKGTPRGYIPPMLEHLAGRKLFIEARKVASLGRFESAGKRGGHADKAAKSMALAQNDSFDVLVFVKDVDRAPGQKKTSSERKRKLAEAHAQIEAGFEQVRGPKPQTIKATPCRMIEAWALGDPGAFKQLARGAQQLPAKPEQLWGDEADPDSPHPKCVLKRVLGADISAATYESISEQSDPAVLERSCPESFAPFAREAREVFRERSSRR